LYIVSLVTSDAVAVVVVAVVTVVVVVVVGGRQRLRELLDVEEVALGRINE